MIDTIYNKSCLDMSEIPDETINCCVTSPPYWGLRDYGTEDQIGLEKTPEQYVEKMVQVFSEVKRALKPEGTLWLNLGDSYNSHSCGKGNVGGIEGKRKNKQDNIANTHRQKLNLKDKDLVGIPWMVAFALRSPHEKHMIKSLTDRAYIAGLVDGEGCITILKTKSSHCESYSYPPIVQIRMCDTEAIDYFAKLIGVNRSEAELYNSHKNNNQRPSYNVKATAQKAMDLIADIYPYLRVKRKQSIVAYNHQLFRSETNYQQRTQKQMERESYCKKLINDLNQRNDIDIPDWMVEPIFKIEPGWYLRQDLIWSKPNPMPESVRDRCTKSHEYIFLLAKSQKYYYDYEAIQEVATCYDGRKDTYFKGGVKYEGFQEQTMSSRGHERWQFKNLQDKGQTTHTMHENRLNGKEYLSPVRNKRSVWTVTTKPFKGAHFATFPEDLIVPCILAGCPEGGIVLDPFMGAGTTALVSKRLDRHYVGYELNPDYIKIAEDRILSQNHSEKLF